MRTKTISDLTHRLGLDFGLLDAHMKEIIESQFKFLRNVIAEYPRDTEERNYKNFRLSNIGMFYVSDARRKWEQKHYKNIKNEKNNYARGSK